MKSISFPSSYKKSIFSGKKNTTVRIGKEHSKYRVGSIYNAKTYGGKDWNLQIKVLKIIRTTFDKLSHYGIPKKSITSICRKYNTKSKTRIEIIRFKKLD
jgi:hypothetical protein